MGGALQVAMLVSGFSYGVTDTACNTLCLATWHGTPARQRGYVALINAMFTIGAFVTPVLVAASLHYLNGVVWPAFHLLCALAMGTAATLACLRDPPASEAADPPEDTGTDVEMEELSSCLGGRVSEVLTSDNDSLRVRAASPTWRGVRESGRLDRCNNYSEPRGTHSKVFLEDSGGDSDGGFSGHSTRSFGFIAGFATRSPAHRRWVLMVSTCMIGFFANGCEHAVATWLSPYGVRRCAVSEEAMAIMTSNFWSTMAAGRCAWAMFSTMILSTWPVLFFNGACCLLSCLLFNAQSERLLWVGAMGAGVGVSSTFPALVTLAAELGIEMTPKMLATLQLTASGGEMAVPFLIGLLFQYRLYHCFAASNTIMQAISLVVLSLSYVYLKQRSKVQPAKTPSGITSA